MYSFCAMYSLRMSACTVPEIFFRSQPRCSARATYIASRIHAVGLIVSDTEIFSRSMSASSASMSASVSIATPSRPTSPSLIGWSES